MQTEQKNTEERLQRLLNGTKDVIKSDETVSKQDKANLENRQLKLQKTVDTVEAELTQTKAASQIDMARCLHLDAATKQIEQLNASLAVAQEACKQGRMYEQRAQELDTSRIDMLELLYTQLGFVAPYNTRDNFKDDCDRGIKETTAYHVKVVKEILEYNENLLLTAQRQRKALDSALEESTATLQAFRTRVSQPIECTCGPTLTSYYDRIQLLEKDLKSALGTIQKLLDKYKKNTANMEADILALEQKLANTTSAYERVKEYVEDKIAKGLLK